MPPKAKLVLFFIVIITEVSEKASQLVSAATGCVVVAARSGLAIVTKAHLVAVLGLGVGRVRPRPVLDLLGVGRGAAAGAGGLGSLWAGGRVAALVSPRDSVERYL